MSFGDFPSFEYLCAVLKCFFFLSTFSMTLQNYCPSISTDSDCLVITGDFNFHTDDLNDKGAKVVFAILDTFELSTCERGYSLYSIITKGLSVSDISVIHPSLSDHFCVFFDIFFIPDIQIESNTIKKRYINEYSTALFKNTMLPPPSPCSTDDLVDNFNSKIVNVIDVIAPAKVKIISGKQKAPWRKPRKENAGKLNASGEKLNFIAQETFFSNIINRNTNNAQTLFATIDRLTNPPTQIPPELLSTQKCKEFASSFTDKIEGIRQNIYTIFLPQTKLLGHYLV
ncbi:hypothetical protein N1851_028946 [Merluccius polli]|uniref:Endonuclease/exonuclease/phosphatase domain-containing protein n=1 Tax=Merluccius polli TaxID=89951 RepID=A0AA47M852_MERPO|nr:hypothetical protein N1851_028946 [Merluccius polli]